MDALYTSTPGNYALTSRPDPVPAADEVVIRVAAAGLCPNEVRLKEGALTTVAFPVVPGHQFAGIVEECGSEVAYLNPGDLVAVHPYVVCGQCPVCRAGGPTHDCGRFQMLGMTVDGGFATRCSVPARHLFPLPDQVSCEEGALVENLANAVSSFRNAQIGIGERVVVFGTWSTAQLAGQTLYIADSGNNVIRRIDADGTLTTVVGTGTAAYAGDGDDATLCSLNRPSSITFGPDGSLWIADTFNQRIRRVAGFLAQAGRG